MDGQHLHILWTNADPVVFDKMVLMYAVNSLVRGWWEKVTVILWGETSRLAATDPAVRERIVLAMEQGVKFSACITCAKELGVEQELRDMGLEVISWGPPLTELQDPGAPADRVTEKKLMRAARQLLFLPVPDLTFFVDVALYNGKRQARGQGGTRGDGDLSG